MATTPSDSQLEHTARRALAGGGFGNPVADVARTLEALRAAAWVP